ncbi:MAG: hypothetical protein IJ747_07765 [Lachnospiraceae bacterium]|nr:hypothetical protein [Lachnospiraceae bacterium]
MERYGVEMKRSDTIRRVMHIPLCLLLITMLLWTTGIQVWADTPADNDDFFILAEKTASDRDTTTVQVTIQNLGADWEGTVRLLPKYRYYGASSAYDTAIALPQGSIKQFSFRIPKSTWGSEESSLRVVLLGKKSKEVAAAEFDSLMEETGSAVNLGILSDDYASLTYLDMGGEELYYRSESRPVALTNVRAETFQEQLGGLQILVIDRFDTSVLSADDRQALIDWNYDGGILLLGTGAYADKVLDELTDHVGMARVPDDSAAVTVPDSTAAEDAPVSGSTAVEGVLDSNSTAVEDAPAPDSAAEDATVPEDGAMSGLSIVDLADRWGRYEQNYYTLEYSCSMGDGAIAVVPYGLVELGKADTSLFGYSTRESFVLTLLEEAIDQTSLRYASSNQSNSGDTFRYVSRTMSYWGNRENRLSFWLLRLIIVLYLIFVGPILYLILILVKKREWYWIGVPVSAVLCIGLIFLAGRGFEVVDTTVYSVSLQNLSDQNKAQSYLYCYDADHSEWSLKLAEGYDYVGKLDDDHYYSSKSNNDYYYHFKREGARNYFGIKPEGSFEDAYFYAGRSGKSDKDYGQIGGKVLVSWTGIYGTVSNDTTEDFAYMAVVADESIYVYKNVKRGDTLDLATDVPVYVSAQSYNVYSNYLYDFLDDDDAKRSKKEVGLLSALGVGINTLYSTDDPDAVIVVGVVDQWDHVVDDRCKEVSYGCLYAIQ